MEIAHRLLKVQPSLTLALQAKAAELKESGIDVCSFAAGEPDFNTPDYIIEAAKKALDQGKTKYGDVAGESKLREAIVKTLKTEKNLTYHKKQIIVTNGGKQALYNALMCLINEGDEVLIPSPYWLSYPEMVKLAGGTPVTVQTRFEDKFKVTKKILEKYVTPKTKLLMINSPSNPTGMFYTQQELEDLADFVIKHNLIVISDEIYEHLIFDNKKHISIASLGSEIFKRTLMTSGFAKSFAMTGWRIGYMAGDQELIEAMSNLQSHSTSNVCTFAQYGAVAALEHEDKSALKEMLATFQKRRDLVVQLLEKIPHIRYLYPESTFYAFIDISETKMDSITFCAKLLEKEHVVLVPGKASGDDSCVRLSFATSEKNIEKGLSKIKNFISTL